MLDNEIKKADVVIVGAGIFGKLQVLALNHQTGQS